MQTQAACADFYLGALFWRCLCQQWKPCDWHTNDPPIRQRAVHHMFIKGYSLRQCGCGDKCASEFATNGQTSIDVTAFSPQRFATVDVAEYLASTVTQANAIRRRH